MRACSTAVVRSSRGPADGGPHRAPEAFVPRRIPGFIRSLLVVLVVAAPPFPAAWSQTADTAQKPAAEATGGTAVAEKGPFEVVLEAKGSLEPVDAVVVKAKLEEWSQPIEVLSVVPHGTRVNAGDVLVQFSTEKLDKAIADLRLDLELGAKSLEIAKRELPALEALNPLELFDAEQRQKFAAEDLARFLAVDRPLGEEHARFTLKAAEERLKYSREELRQLEKMYKDKDLTEETEEMILQRTRFEVASAEFQLKNAGVSSERELTILLPRREQDLREASARAAIQLDTAKATLPLELDQKRLALAKQEHDRGHALSRLRELEQDKARTTLKSPRAGIVYYGRSRDGQWTTATVSALAVAGKAVAPGDLELTVVDPDRVRFRAKLEESDLHLVGAGMTGKVEATGFPGSEAPAVMEPFVAVPKDGGYAAVFAVTPEAGGPRLLAGMSGTVRCVVSSRPDAVTLPAGAVFREADGTRVVYLDGKEGRAERRTVKAGRTHGGRTEILEGIAAGERVRTKKP